ncbi:MAG: nuclear transport factor 2 family protein [Proteobacteria bacterium]|nr:nuclear transport factor 2 family protein [Pseudomonadota bacterium]
MSHGIRLAVIALTIASPLPAMAQSTADLARLVAEQGPIVEAVRTFITAQHDFDLATIERMTAEDYVEISPLGEVDPRAKMLGFYTPDKKVAAPAMQIGDSVVTMIDDRAAVVTTSVSYGVGTAGEPPRTLALRAVFVARRVAKVWKLVSAQYTPIRSKN